MLRFHLKACPKCHGDLALDEGDWLCLQCGTYYYTRLYRKPVPVPVPVPITETRIEELDADRAEKAASPLTTAAHEISQLPDLATTAIRRGGSREPGSGRAAAWQPEIPQSLGVVAGTGSRYDQR